MRGSASTSRLPASQKVFKYWYFKINLCNSSIPYNFTIILLSTIIKGFGFYGLFYPPTSFCFLTWKTVRNLSCCWSHHFNFSLTTFQNLAQNFHLFSLIFHFGNVACCFHFDFNASILSNYLTVCYQLPSVSVQTTFLMKFCCYSSYCLLSYSTWHLIVNPYHMYWIKNGVVLVWLHMLLLPLHACYFTPSSSHHCTNIYWILAETIVLAWFEYILSYLSRLMVLFCLWLCCNLISFCLFSAYPDFILFPLWSFKDLTCWPILGRYAF